jgi:hypothetical protein
VNRFESVVTASLVVAAAASAPAQTPASSARAEADARQLRYHIGQMERVIEGAVEHGVTIIRDRYQQVMQMPADVLVTDNAHARGFRLEGYGVFFDVAVPSFEASSLVWSLRTLDQNDLGLQRAVTALEEHVKQQGDASLEQALKRLELQVGPVALARVAAPPVAGARTAVGSAATTTADAAAPQATPPDPILVDPNEAYRAEVIQAIKDAMLDHSSSLAIGAGEWLTVAARGNDDRPRLAPADSDARTRIIRLSGTDLAAFLARQITRDEALQRIEVRVF